MNYYVLFLDMLGTQSKVLDAAKDINKSKMHYINRQFDLFHSIIDKALDFSGLNVSDFSIISFSDCVYVITPKFDLMDRIIDNCFSKFFDNELPVNGGIGFGEYYQRDFSLKFLNKNSFFISKFFGSGIVYAFDAVKKGKGMRIFVSPSMNDTIQTHPRLFVRYTDGSENDKYEYNLINLDMPSEIFEKYERMKLATIKMQKKSPAIDSVQIHYKETLKALERIYLHERESIKAI